LPWSLKDVGGVNEVVKSLIRCFQAGGVFSPHVLISNESSNSDTAGLAIDKPLHLTLWPHQAQRHPARTALSFFLGFPARCREIRRSVKQLRISVINPHYPDLGALNFLAMKRMGLFRGKLVLSFHGSDIRGALHSRGIKRFLWRILVRGADRIVVVSNDLATDVLALEPRSVENLRMIYSGVDLDLFASTRRDPEREQSPPVERPDILSVGNFIQHKGHDVLVRAFAHVVRQIPNAHLTLVGGDGPEFARIRELVESLSLSGNVSLIRDAPHERIPEFFSEARLFALASRRESFGLVVLEAAAAKVPVVCTDACGLRGLITHGVTGRLVGVDDVAALAEALVGLLNNPHEARKLANRLYEEVKGKFTWKNTYKGYLGAAGIR
jgi:glycosyltransferase involved in cell wall biosynthesis